MGFDVSQYAGDDPVVQTIYEQEGWRPGAPVGASGDAGLPQIIPSTARMMLGQQSAAPLFQKYPELHEYADPMSATPDPKNDPLANFLNDPKHQDAADALGKSYIGYLKNTHTGWESDPTALFKHYNGSGEKADEYAAKSVARYRQLQAAKASAPGSEYIDPSSPLAQQYGPSKIQRAFSKEPGITREQIHEGMREAASARGGGIPTQAQAMEILSRPDYDPEKKMWGQAALEALVRGEKIAAGPAGVTPTEQEKQAARMTLRDQPGTPEAKAAEQLLAGAGAPTGETQFTGAPTGEASAAPAREQTPMDAYAAAMQEQQDALALQAQHEAALDDQQADVLHKAGQQIDAMGPPPNAKMVDPKQYYANIGHALGAASPGAARLIGGIASGLFAGLGTLGAAIAHTHNDALDIIRSGIEQNISAQNQNNQLTNENWANQYGYILKQVQAKAAELAGGSQSQAIHDNYGLTVAGLNLQFATMLAQKGMLSPDASMKTGRYNEAKESLQKYVAARNQAARTMSPSDIHAAIIARQVAKEDLMRADTMNPRGPGEFDEKSADALFPDLTSPDAWQQDNVGLILEHLNTRVESITRAPYGMNQYRTAPPIAANPKPGSMGMPAAPSRAPAPAPPRAPQRAAVEAEDEYLDE